MKVVSFDSLRPPTGGAARFIGADHGANVSFFISKAGPGLGAERHRHRYEEVFVILEGEIEAVVEGETYRVASDNVVVIPANSWHEFKNITDRPVLMVNIHPAAQMSQEWAEE